MIIIAVSPRRDAAMSRHAVTSLSASYDVVVADFTPCASVVIARYAPLRALRRHYGLYASFRRRRCASARLRAARPAGGSVARQALRTRVAFSAVDRLNPSAHA